MYPDGHHLTNGDRGQAPLTSTLITQALEQSPDGGLTVVLSKLNLSDVSAEAAEELATTGRNKPEDDCTVERITLGNNRLTTLPTEFALMSRLRYLNLKHNNFANFPDVLTVMPALDTLDISHNKIKRFPLRPGRLLELRVFSFTRNKLTQLPPYFSQFHNLELLRLDRNPLEWPPRNILDLESRHDTEQDMKDWIRSILDWIDYNTSSAKVHDDSGFSESLELENSIKQDRHKAWRFPLREPDAESGPSSHARAFSTDSNISAADSFLEAETSAEFTQPHISMELVQTMDASPSLPLDAYLPSPSDSDQFDGGSSSSQAELSDQSHESPSHHHLRASSVATEQRSSTTSRFSGKQSLPDLRSPQWSQPPNAPDQGFPGFPPSRHANGILHPPIPSRQSSITALDVQPDFRLSVFRSRTTPSMAFERNSYFQRLSSMPALIKLPTPLSHLVEAARSILFVTSQIYQTIEHYANHAIDEKDSSIFKKVLEPANTDMLQLIRSLDRFDAISQKMPPSSPICRSLVENCRNTIAVTEKAVSLFAIQLRIAPCEDFRYSRWILLELYASTAEISVAWQNLLPHWEALKTFLQGKSSQTHPTSEQPPGSNPQTSNLYPAPRLRNTDFSSVRTHNARRHAGSFSHKDVEIGKQLPNYDLPLNLPGRGAIPTLRTPKRQATAPPSMPSSAASFSPSRALQIPFAPMPNFGLEEATSDDPQDRPMRSAPGVYPSSSRLKSLDLPETQRQRLEKDALQSLCQTIDFAAKVWDTVEDALGSSDPATRETLRKARDLTRKLSVGLRNVNEHDRNNDTQLIENVQLFSKVVNQMSNLTRSSVLFRSGTSNPRPHLSKLAESMEEHLRLLHLPPSSSRPYSPSFSNPFSTPAGVEDNRLTSSLSRTRSAQPTPSLRPTFSTFNDSPRSAIPTSSFKIPSIGRLPSREARSDNVDPG